MELVGTIEDFIFQNDQNGYSIAVFETEDGVITTVVGYLPFVESGDYLKLVGKEVVHKDYGEQFKVESFEKIMPQSVSALEKYLASGNIKGIGQAIAKRIIDKFGEETINIIKYEPDKLALVKGITASRAMEIAAEFNEKWELWQIVGFLEKYGIGPNNSKKVFDELGADAIKKIEENPYILVDIVYGVDFNKIDKIALSMGIDKNSDSRVNTGIKYALVLAGNNGNTCVQKESLIVYTLGILQVSRERVEECLINLNVTKQIVIEKFEDDEYVYLAPYYDAEQNISYRINKLKNYENCKKVKNLKKEITKLEGILEIKLSDKQYEALKLINDNNVCIITGGPGTGKTTIIKFILNLFAAHNEKVVLCAPTGRAAKRITEATGEEAKTIHRLLEIGKTDEDKLKSIETQIAPIDADVIVIDEMSMVDTVLMNYIVNGCYLGTKLVLVGDCNQLPSVGPGNILKDLIDSETVPVIGLNKIFRQAEKSKIIVNAHNVNNGVSFIGLNDYVEDVMDDFFYVNEQNQDKMLISILSLCKERLKKYGNYDFFTNIQVLTPTKKGKLGTKELNKSLQAYLNPDREELNEKTYGNVIYREGDRVMQIKNNYDIYWEKGRKNSNVRYENGTGIFNGEIGRIAYIDNESKQLEVDFDDGKTAWYTFSELDELEHAYAITIHKAQGSEFDVVILAVPQASNMLLTRNLLYTGITRAKKMIIVLSNDRLIDFMINNSENKKRNTGLKYKLKT